MKPHFNEVVLESFRIDAESLRYMDAVVRKFAAELIPEPTLSYGVVRSGTPSYSTNDIEEITREGNGKNSEIQSLSLDVNHGNNLKLSVVFDQKGAKIDAESQDRAKLFLLVSELRNLIQGRMAGRGSTGKRRVIGDSLPYASAAFTFLSLIALGSRNTNQRAEQNKIATREYEEKMQKESEENQDKITEQLSAARAEGVELKERGTEQEKLDFLIDQVTFMPNEAYMNSSFSALDYPEFPASPWYFSFIALVLFTTVAILIGLVLSNLLAPRAERIFLIGEKVDTQKKRDKNRDNFIWAIVVGVPVAILLGIFVNKIS